jgi:hypothetical protein
VEQLLALVPNLKVEVLDPVYHQRLPSESSSRRLIPWRPELWRSIAKQGSRMASPVQRMA